MTVPQAIAEQLEWDVTYQTRIGSLVGKAEDVPGWAREMAEREADEAVKAMKKQAREAVAA